MIEYLLPVLSGTMLFMTIVYSIYMVLKEAEVSYQRSVYISIMLFWGFAIFSLIVRQLYFVINGIEIDGYLYCSSIILGMICLLSMLWYVIAVLFQKRILVKWIIILLLPAVLTVVANLAWNHYNDIPLTHHFSTFADFKANIFSTTALLRYSMLIVQLAYILILIYSIKRLVPIYDKYISETHSNEQYNLHWLYKYYRVICMISVVYFILCFFPNNYTYTLYCIVAASAFVIFTSCVWEYRSFPKIEDIKPSWTLIDGWSAKFSNETEGDSIAEHQIDSGIVVALERYIIDHQLYANVDLMMKELLANYPNLTSNELIYQLDQEGATFQSFIRKIRIERAAEIIRASENKMQYKDIFYQVGFSHYSSFSRAFTSVMGVSPANYNQQGKSSF